MTLTLTLTLRLHTTITEYWKFYAGSLDAAYSGEKFRYAHVYKAQERYYGSVYDRSKLRWRRLPVRRVKTLVSWRWTLDLPGRGNLLRVWGFRTWWRSTGQCWRCRRSPCEQWCPLADTCVSPPAPSASTITHKLFSVSTRKSNPTQDVEYCMPPPVGWRFQHNVIPPWPWTLTFWPQNLMHSSLV